MARPFYGPPKRDPQLRPSCASIAIESLKILQNLVQRFDPGGEGLQAGSSPRWTDFCRFCCIAPGTRTSARRSVLRVIYYHYDEYLARMRRDIAPVHDIATFCTLQEPQITTDDPETTRGHALQTCCTRHLRRHAQPLHCMRLDRTLCRHPSLSSDKRTTTEAEQELLTSWTCRRSARS
jgi:hypothetical protein